MIGEKMVGKDLEPAIAKIVYEDRIAKLLEVVSSLPKAHQRDIARKAKISPSSVSLSNIFC